MNYTELTGQESGIWIYKENKAALIVNWSSSDSEDREPVVFGDICQVWFPPSNDEPVKWVKTAEEVDLDDYLTDIDLIWDANNDATKGLEGMTGDVWESDEYIIVAPKGWN